MAAPEHQRYFITDNIAQDTTKNTGDHPHHDTDKHRHLRLLRQRRPGHTEQTQAQRVSQHNGVFSYRIAQMPQKRDECLAKVQAMIQQAVDQGQLHPDTDTWIAMQASHAYVIGIVHEWLEDSSAYCLMQHAEDMVDIFMAGLVARPPLKKSKPAEQGCNMRQASGQN